MSMFDKLGDLLSEVLETGELPENKADSPDFFSREEESPQKEERAEEKTGGQSSKSNPAFSKTKVQAIPDTVKSAFDFIGISEEADFDSAKKIYREKLMYYHPDRRNSNPVLQKVAKEKTERLLREWKTVEKWYEESKNQKPISMSRTS